MIRVYSHTALIIRRPPIGCALPCSRVAAGDESYARSRLIRAGRKMLDDVSARPRRLDTRFEHGFWVDGHGLGVQVLFASAHYVLNPY